MKKLSRLTVLLAAVLALVTLFSGVASAEAATELNANLSDIEAALSAEEVQAEVAYQRLMGCATIQEMYAALFEGEEALFPVLYSMNQEQLSGAYNYAMVLYDPETDDMDYYEMVCDAFIVVAEDNEVELYGSGEKFDDYTINLANDSINDIDDNVSDGVLTIANNDKGGEANWSFDDGVLTINTTVKIPQGQSLDILVASGDNDDKGKIVAGTALGNKPMFIVEGKLKIAKTQNNDNQNHGSIEINGGTIEVKAGGSLHMEDITTVSGTTEWKFAEGSSVEIFGDIPVSGKLTITGPSKDSPVNITRRYTESSMFYVNNGASLSIANAVIDGKDTEVDSEIIFVQSNTESLPSTTATVNVTNTTFKNCNNTSSSSRSGAITFGGYSRFSLTVDGCTFDNCKSVSGAGIYFVGDANGTASIKNSTFMNCTTQQGGAIRTNGNGGVVATVEQCVFKNNCSTNPSTGDSHGGAIYWNACGERADGTTAKMNIYDCQFIGNSTEMYAGAVFNESFMTIGTRYTSGFTTTETAPGSIRGTLITKNKAKYGGGVEVPTYGGGAEPHDGVGAELTLNTGVFIIGNEAEYGGGLAMRVGKGTVGDANPQDVKFEININGAVIKDNTATVMGGGIYLERMEGYDLYPSTVNLNSGIISGNSAPKGGAVCVYNENQEPSTKTNEVNIGSTNGNLVVEKNTSTEFGGAVYISYGDVTMINGTIQENEAKYGGAIYVDNGQYEMTGGTIQNNNANENGGAVYVGGGSFTISGGMMDSNVATANGGAAYVSGGAVTIGAQGSNNNATPMLSNNHAVNGGAIYVDGQTPTMYCGTLSGNYATNSGGAVYVSGGGFTMHNGTVSGNGLNGETVETDNGGAVYVSGGTFTMNNGTFSGNKVTANGGAVYVTGNNAEFIMQNGTASSNAAQNGGAVYVSGGEFIMANGMFTGNNSTANGGAVYVSDGAFTMNNGMFSGNEAAQSGGAAYVSGGSFVMDGGQVNQNEALNGGAVYVSNGTVHVKSGSMLNNDVATKAKAQNATEGSNMGYGGAIFTDGGEITIGISGCTGGEDNSEHTSNRTHPVITGNKAIYGGALAVRSKDESGGQVTVYCCQIKENVSDNTGTGTNVFMDGENAQITHYLDSAEIGTKVNHGMVSIGGNLTIEYTDKNGTEQKFEITIVYDPYDTTNSYAEWTGTAPEDYYLNLPYCSEAWESVVPTNSFVGWTIEKINPEDFVASVRDRDDYYPIGTPVKLVDQDDNLNDNVHRMTFYAVWANAVNDISYVFSLDGENITKGTDEKFQVGNAPANYSYASSSYDLQLTTPTYPGYRFVRWAVYANSDTPSNWNADPVDLDSTATDGTFLNSSEITLISQLRTNDNNLDESDAADLEGVKINAPDATIDGNVLNIQRKFGDITLVAVFEPAFAGLKIVVTDGTDAKLSKLDANESYVFQIDGDAYDDKSDVTMFVSVIPDEDGYGNTTIYNLPVGKYTVTELGDWSWRYTSTGEFDNSKDEEIKLPDGIQLYTRSVAHDVNDQSVTEVNLDSLTEGKTVTFTVERTNAYWLDDNDNRSYPN